MGWRGLVDMSRRTVTAASLIRTSAIFAALRLALLRGFCFWNFAVGLIIDIFPMADLLDENYSILEGNSKGVERAGCGLDVVLPV
jgi:hypothetical protein